VIFRNPLALVTAGLLALAAAALVVLPAAPAIAQAGMEEVQDEGSAYRAWHQASQAGDNTKAMEAAKAYLAKYPTGQYVQFLTGWLGTAKMAAFDAALREKRAADAVAAGKEILKEDPENLNILYPLAFAAPAPDNLEFAKKAIALLEAGKTMANVPNFDKNNRLAWLTNVLAVDAQKSGKTEEALKLYQQSLALAPQDPQVAGKNLYAIFGLRFAGYGEAAKAWNAIPEADRTAAEPKPEVKAAAERVKQESDTVVDSGAAFVAFAKTKNLPVAVRDKVNATLEAIYKSRHPEDATLAGLQKLLQEKEAALGAAPAAPGN
jgi:tetratricopeptide (TPR) repeat protein